MSESTANYALFYEELGKPHPKIGTIVRLGITIRTKIDRLKIAYSDLIKTKLISFKMVELYL
jgi:hypothetical protein